jgi:hypothetical protein
LFWHDYLLQIWRSIFWALGYRKKISLDGDWRKRLNQGLNQGFNCIRILIVFCNKYLLHILVPFSLGLWSTQQELAFFAIGAS